MSDKLILPLTLADLDEAPDLERALLDLNNEHADELGLINATRFRSLVNSAFRAARIGAVEAFVIAVDQTAIYDSLNFLWFRERYRRFVYLDRIVTSGAARRRGHARELYAYLIARAHAAGHERIVCEVNFVPPNPVSEAFHRRFGFRAVGAAALQNGKSVTYLDCPSPEGDIWPIRC